MDEPIAIVGMACIYPGAPNLEAFFDNIVAGRDSITAVPSARLDRKLYGSPDGVSAFRCWRGGFIDEHARFSPLQYGIMPVAARQAEPDQLLALAVAEAALRDTGMALSELPRARTGVILGKGNYAGAAQLRLQHELKGAAQLLTALEELLPSVSHEELRRVRLELSAKLEAPKADGMIGVVPNLTASRIANHHDFGGAAYTVDAACASSLLAVEQACRELTTGNADMMLCGGVHVSPSEVFWSVFSGLGALSDSEQIRPFDQRADGLLIGEGIGIVVLRRLSDALRRGERVYAAIHGAASSSDGRGTSLMNPNVEGQVAAVDRAWRRAGLDPADVGLIEAHGTGTPTGDAAEVETLRRCFSSQGNSRPAVVGSVKSMIGHAMPAAGVAGLIKAAMSIHREVLPPTLHCEQPREDLRATRFSPIAKSRPWADSRRLAGVNAFGFGGVNGHVVLAASPRSRAPMRRGASSAPSAPTPLRIAAEDVPELLRMLERGESGGSGPVRLAVAEPSAERIDRARSLVERGRPLTGRMGFYFTPEAGHLRRGGKLAFLFPGFDARFDPQIDDVARHFDLQRPELQPGRSLEDWGTGITRVNMLLHGALAQLGVRAELVAGHSVGEWSAMVAAGIITPAELERAMARMVPGAVPLPDVEVVAVAAGAERVRGLLGARPQLEISHDNCPRQTIVCAPAAAMEEARQLLVGAGLLCQRMPFDGGVHTSHYAPHVEGHRQAVEAMQVSPPRVPAYSATTCAPYPRDAAEVQALWVEHLVKPVRFRELLERLHQDGARVFLEVGTGSLTGFVEDTLRGRPHLAVQTNVASRSGLDQLTRAACALWVEGAEIDFARLLPAAAHDAAHDAAPAAAHDAAKATTKHAGPTLALCLGVPLAHFDEPLRLSPAAVGSSVRGSTDDPVTRLFDENLEQLAAAQRSVAAGLARPAQSGPARAAAPLRSQSATTATSTTTRTLGLDTLPELIDHTFYRQREGWPDVRDRRPVVPLTALLEIMAQTARELAPGRLVVGMERIWARRWLDVPSPIDVPIHHRALDDTRLEVRIGEYTQGIVHLGERYDDAPAFEPLRAAELGTPTVEASAVYRDHWMFHGPAYQGIQRIEGVSDAGIQGLLCCGDALGALLDNAGQLFGLWIATQTRRDRLAMPTRVRRIRFHGPPPPPRTPVACSIRIGELKPRSARCDIRLALGDAAGPAFATLEGWEDVRFPAQGRLWDLALWPERHTLAEPQDERSVRLSGELEGIALLDYLEGRFLRRDEREALEGLAPRPRRAALLDRVAAKDAVRHFLWQGEQGDTFPAEVVLQRVSAGRYRVEQPRALWVQTRELEAGILASVEPTSGDQTA